MEKIDAETLESLLDKNPRVNREAIKARQEKLSKDGPRVKITGDSASPYGRKRIASDEQIKWRSPSRLGSRRTRYQSM
jgi:hypothetical protein